MFSFVLMKSNVSFLYLFPLRVGNAQPPWNAVGSNISVTFTPAYVTINHLPWRCQHPVVSQNIIEQNFVNRQRVPNEEVKQNQPAFQPRPQVLQPNPFSGSGFGQPTSFAAPVHLPNMSGLANKTFGSQNAQFQGFSAVAPVAPSSFSNPNPNPSQNLGHEQTSHSFFKMRK